MTHTDNPYVGSAMHDVSKPDQATKRKKGKRPERRVNDE